MDQAKHVEGVSILHHLIFVRGAVCVPVGVFGGASVDGFEGVLFFEITRAVQPRRKSSNGFFNKSTIRETLAYVH